MYHLSSKTPLHILYEDTQIIVCVKPPGIATQTRSTGAPDMVRLLKQHLYQINPASGEPYLAVIHRLDQPVSGLLVFAKTPAAARELNRQLQNPDKTSFGKYYCALVEGRPPKPSGILENYMCRDPLTNTSRICDPGEKNAKLARLEYEVVENSFGWGRGISRNPPSPSEGTTLFIHIFTGRHHQIRVQLAHMGCPIVGDTKYNPHSREIAGITGITSAPSGHPDTLRGQSDVRPTARPWQQICLCACRLTFFHPTTKKPMAFQISNLEDYGF